MHGSLIALFSKKVSLIFGISFALISCGGGGSAGLPSTDSTPPVIIKTSPNADQLVSNNTFIKVTFDEAVQLPETIDVNIFRFDTLNDNFDKSNTILLDQTTPFDFDPATNELIIHPFVYTGIELNPKTLQTSTKYQVNIKGVKNSAGLSMASECRFEFATIGYQGSVAKGADACSVPTLGVKPTELTFIKGTTSLGENTSSVAITVQRRGGTIGTITVNFKTTDGTAVNRADYIKNTGTLSFLDGETTKTITLKIVNDATAEGDKSFTLSLSNPSTDVTLGATATHTITIIDDDNKQASVLGFAAITSSLAENTQGGSAVITVLRTSNSADVVSVNYATSDGTALDGEDYTATSGTLRFANGETQRSIFIPIINDTRLEENEDFKIILSSPSVGSNLGTNTIHTLTIINDDNGGTPQNVAPTASAIKITDDNFGTVVVGDLLLGSYSYNDVDLDKQGATTFRWFRNGSAIPNAIAQNYTVQTDDAGQKIKFEVTPVALKGVLTGVAAQSLAITVDAIVVINAAPIASAVKITGAILGKAAVGDLLKGSYSYSDAEKNKQGVTIFKWLLNNVTIPNETSQSYTVQPNDAGKNIIFEVTPVALSGTLSGIASPSLPVLIDAIPVTNNYNLGKTFPANNANLAGATTTTVTGQVTRNDAQVFVASDISFVSVNSVIATFDVTDTSKWSAQIPVTEGLNDLSVTVQYRDNTTDVINTSINNSKPIVDPRGMVIDSANDRVLFVDKTLRSLVAVNLSTGVKTIISDLNKGTGIFYSPESITLDSANNRVLVSDLGCGCVHEVNLGTGNRTVMSGAGYRGTGVSTLLPTGVVIDSANSRAFVVSQGTTDTTTGSQKLQNLVRFDLAKGNRTILFDSDTKGTGLRISEPVGLIHDSVGNRVFVVDKSYKGLTAINLANNSISVFSSSIGFGTGPAMPNPSAAVLDRANSRIFVVDKNADALFSVNLSNGNRTIISDANKGGGVNFDNPAGVTYDSANARVLVTDSALNAIIAVDLTNGNRSEIFNASKGTGLNLRLPKSAVLDATNNRALVIDEIRKSLIAIDLTTGNRTIVSGPLVTFNLGGMVLDQTNNRVLLIDSGVTGVLTTARTRQAIYAIDLTSGKSTVISDSSKGAGVAFVYPHDLVLDSVNNRVLVTEQEQVSGGRVIAVNLTSGNRSIISDSKKGVGSSLSRARGIILDGANRAIIADGSFSLIAIELGTGNRSFVSSFGIGIGPDFNSPTAIERVTGTQIFVSDGAGIMSVDLLTGNRAIVTSSIIKVAKGTGTRIFNAQSVLMDNASNRLFLLDSKLKALIEIEPVSGDRSIFSN